MAPLIFVDESCIYRYIRIQIRDVTQEHLVEMDVKACISMAPTQGEVGGGK